MWQPDLYLPARENERVYMESLQTGGWVGSFISEYFLPAPVPSGTFEHDLYTGPFL